LISRKNHIERFRTKMSPYGLMIFENISDIFLVKALCNIYFQI